MALVTNGHYVIIHFWSRECGIWEIEELGAWGKGGLGEWDIGGTRDWGVAD